MKALKNDTKKQFLTRGTCSHVLFYLLNREFGNQKGPEERASDLLAGGIMQCGYQCGMLWGATLGAGAESFRRHTDRDQAIAMTIMATQGVVESFSKRAKCVNCREITKTDWRTPLGMVKYFLTGKLFTCLNLAEKWAPEAIQSIKEGTSRTQPDVPPTALSCASEVAKKMGASDEEMVMVAGFAGGIGLSGNGCGALSAAIWMKSLAWCKKHPGKSPPFFKNAEIANLIKAFCGVTDSHFPCHTITGQCFRTVNEHSEFLKSGGCTNIINVLAQS
jgi:hypothetical protein